MKYKCDKCDRPATHHAVVRIKGQNIQKRLCEQHAAEEGLPIKSAHAPINELLTNFIKMADGQGQPTGKNKPAPATRRDRACPDCGLKFSDFRDKSLLGCSGCYKAFEKALIPLLERAHEGGAQHVGKVPRRSGGGEQRQLQITRIRKRLDEAVSAENYELAAQLRDDLTGMEAGQSTAPPRALDPGTSEEGPA